MLHGLSEDLPLLSKPMDSECIQRGGQVPEGYVDDATESGSGPGWTSP